MKHFVLSFFAALALLTAGCAGSTEEPTDDVDHAEKTKESAPPIAVPTTGAATPQRVFHRLCIEDKNGVEIVSLNTCLWWWD